MLLRRTTTAIMTAAPSRIALGQRIPATAMYRNAMSLLGLRCRLAPTQSANACLWRGLAVALGDGKCTTSNGQRVRQVQRHKKVIEARERLYGLTSEGRVAAHG